MRIQLTQDWRGYAEGDVINKHDDVAAGLIESGVAVTTEDATPEVVEVAEVVEPKPAAKKKAKRTRKLKA